jgi:hypothetical protein
MRDDCPIVYVFCKIRHIDWPAMELNPEDADVPQVLYELCATRFRTRMALLRLPS